MKLSLQLRPRSLRAQLALWYAGAMALTLLLVATVTYGLLDAFLSRRADESLQASAEEHARAIARLLVDDARLHPGRAPDTAAFIDAQSGVPGAGPAGDPQGPLWGRYLEVIDPHGNVVAASDALRTVHFPTLSTALSEGLRGRRASFVTVEGLAAYPVRIVTVPVRVAARIPYLVEEGVSVEVTRAASERATAILVVLMPCLFVVALLGGWALVGGALQPVDAMTQAALTADVRRLDSSIVPPRTDNEIGRLAAAFNEMIARLARTFQQMERFSADASHELKTPLTAIRGEAEVALLGERSPEEYRATLASIVEETDRLSAIVNNMLLLSRVDADHVRLKKEYVPLHEAALAALDSVETLAHRKRIALDVGTVDDVTVCGDRLWLEQLASNLLVNAVKYTPEGGSVTLSVCHDGGAALLSVRDTGPGIPAEHLPHLFDRFYRVDSGRSRDMGGSGLGLNIARWIAESHGGTVSVISVPGEGSEFTVTLPVHSGPRPLA